MAQPVYSSDNPFAAKARSGNNRSYFSRRAQAWEKDKAGKTEAPKKREYKSGTPKPDMARPRTVPQTERAEKAAKAVAAAKSDKPAEKVVTRVPVRKPERRTIESTKPLPKAVREYKGEPRAPSAEGQRHRAEAGKFLSERVAGFKENLGKLAEAAPKFVAERNQRFKENIGKAVGAVTSVATPAEAGKSDTKRPAPVSGQKPYESRTTPEKSSPNKVEPSPAPTSPAKPEGSVAKPVTTTAPGTTASPAAKPASTVVKPKGEGAKPRNVDKIAVKPQKHKELTHAEMTRVGKPEGPQGSRVEPKVTAKKADGMGGYLKSHGGMPWPKDGKDAPARPEAGKAWKDRAHRKDTMVWDKGLGRMTDRGVSGLKRERMK